MTTRVVWAAIVVLVVVTRFAHIDLVWIEEAYSMAAASEVLRGKVLYRDIWFDKPPLYALIYTMWGAESGLPLRVVGAVHILLSCVLLYTFARSLWGTLEATCAAAALSLYLTFGIPSAVIALAPDLLMVPAHIAAVYLAWRRQPLASGTLASICVLFNAKGLFVALTCVLWNVRAWRTFLIGLAIPHALFISWAAFSDALPGYLHQVWIWGARYSSNTFITNPLSEGVIRTLNWAGFHASLVLAGVIYARREGDRRLIIWMIFSLLAVIAGYRFFPRYYFQLLPVMCLAAARGFAIGTRTWRTLLVLLLLIPTVRFAPRYVKLIADKASGNATVWSDIAMMQDSRNVALQIRALSQPADSLLVWGYRPDVFVFSVLKAGTRFLDSQPLTGVLADRHLGSSVPTFPELARVNRLELSRTAPTFLVDGLGPINHDLAISQYADLADWLNRYEVVAKTEMSVIYKLRSPDRSALGEKR